MIDPDLIGIDGLGPKTKDLGSKIRMKV